MLDTTQHRKRRLLSADPKIPQCRLADGPELLTALPEREEDADARCEPQRDEDKHDPDVESCLAPIFGMHMIAGLVKMDRGGAAGFSRSIIAVPTFLETLICSHYEAQADLCDDCRPHGPHELSFELQKPNVGQDIVTLPGNVRQSSGERIGKQLTTLSSTSLTT